MGLRFLVVTRIDNLQRRVTLRGNLNVVGRVIERPRFSLREHNEFDLRDGFVFRGDVICRAGSFCRRERYSTAF